jgi:hypothetical protein
MFEVKYQPKVNQCSLGAHSVPAGCVAWSEFRRTIGGRRFVRELKGITKLIKGLC